MVDLVDSPFTSHGTSPGQLPAAAKHVLYLEQELKKFERFTLKRQNSLLSAQLLKFIDHAKRYSAYWRERIGSPALGEGSPEEILQSLPSLSRSDLQTRFDELMANFPRRGNMRTSKLTTSGTTGTPVSVVHLNDVHNPGQHAAMMLTKRWHKMDPKKPLGTLRPTVEDLDRATLGIPFCWYGPVAIGFSRCTKDREPGELYEYCAQKKPSYLLCDPSLLSGFPRYAINNDRHDWRPEIALSLGTVVTDEIRDRVRKGLGAKIVDRYSCEEVGIIAVQCPKHDHLHVLSPITIVEILDESGKPCPVGQIGRVFITNIQSYAMPLIRYDIGDMAEWGEPCDLGITLPVIKKLWGRHLNMITHPDGQKSYVAFYARDFEDLRDVEEYRFVLHQNAVVVAQLKVTKHSPELPRIITEGVQRVLEYPYPVKIQYVNKIDWGSSWKKESFAVSDAAPPEGL